MCCCVRAIDQRNLNIYDRLSDQKNKIIDQKLKNHSHFRTGINSESTFTERVTQFWQLINSGPTQDQCDEPGQNQNEGSCHNYKLICGCDHVILVQSFDLKNWSDSSIVGSGDAGLIHCTIAGNSQAPNEPNGRKKDGPKCLYRTAFKS